MDQCGLDKLFEPGQQQVSHLISASSGGTNHFRSSGSWNLTGDSTPATSSPKDWEPGIWQTECRIIVGRAARLSRSSSMRKSMLLTYQ